MVNIEKQCIRAVGCIFKDNKIVELSNECNIERVDIFLRYCNNYVLRCCQLLTQRTVSEISAVFKPQMITYACCVFAHLTQPLLSHITRTIVVRIVFYRP